MGRPLKNSLKHFKIETRRTRGVPECMRISRFMHGVNNPELIKRLNEHVSKTLEEMMTADPRLLYGEKPRLLLRRNQRIGEGPDTTTDECVQLKKQIEELVRAGRLSHFIKEIWQDKDQQKTELDRIIEITSPPLTVSKGTKGPLVIEAEIGGHAVHRMYVDGGSSMEWGIQYGRRQLRLLVTIGDAEHSTKAWMNFMIAGSPSPYNGIIGLPRIREIQAVPSTAHGMIKFLPSDMTGVPRSIAEHRLNIRDGYPPVRQKKRGQAPERAKAIQAEVQKLVEAGIMREVYYHDWLSNPVMVKKHDGSWRMCVDFTDLNKACPHDCYPLPEIDWKVESLCGYPFKCFLDAYKGYHQIHMAEADEEKTAFHTPQGVYCYTKMPFGLKNAGATYQRLVDKAFDKQVGRNLEVYVDDLVIKSHTETELLRDIEETFRTLRKINMKLNPKKCTFGAEEGMFLGYMIGPEGIKPCPDKVSLQVSGKILAALQNLKEMHQKSDFHWTSEAEQAFKHLKQHISELPMLVAPRPKEELIMYLSASHGVVGAVLMTERDTVQTSVYFVSRALQGAELNYTPMEKLILALVCAAKRLRRYFQAHPVAVITDQPIKQIISRPDVAGRLQKWRIMLGEHNITYRPWTSVKGQILADFLVEKPDEVLVNTSVKERGRIRSAKSDVVWILLSKPGHRDARDMIRKCLLPEGPGKVKFLIVAMDYFTKWIEAKAVATISGTQVKKFVWDNIICRFGLPGEIVSDNGKQFSGDPFKDWVRGVTFRPGDFVYRSNDASHAVDGGKLGPKWEGPYEVMESLVDGAYKLRSTDGTVLPRTWKQLRQFVKKMLS
ncbi:reverse transcriptase domain-containing protein [Tanacetum coccineum]